MKKAAVPKKAAVLGVILAGGRGRRLGGVNKAAIEVRGRTLAERAFSLLSTFCSEVVITGPDPDRISGLNIRVVRDEETVRGPLGGLIAGLRLAEERGLAGVIVLGVDQIGVTKATIDRILLAADVNAAAVLADRNGPVPTVGYMPTDNWESIADNAGKGDRSLSGAFRSAVRVMAISDETSDIDFPKDLARPCLNSELP